MPGITLVKFTLMTAIGLAALVSGVGIFLNYSSTVTLDDSTVTYGTSNVESRSPSITETYPDTAGIIPLTPTLKPTANPSPRPTLRSTPSPSSTPIVKPTPTPSKNEYKPEVKILTSRIDSEFTNGSVILLEAWAYDELGAIRYVEFYEDDDLLEKALTLPPIGGKTITSGIDSAVLTEKGSQWLEDEIGSDDEVMGYLASYNRDWGSKDKGCGVSKGYMVVYITNKFFYDVRMPEDLDESDFKICSKTKYFNIDRVYTILYEVDGDSEFWVKAYDDDGASTSTDTEKIRAR